MVQLRLRRHWGVSRHDSHSSRLSCQQAVYTPRSTLHGRHLSSAVIDQARCFGRSFLQGVHCTAAAGHYVTTRWAGVSHTAHSSSRACSSTSRRLSAVLSPIVDCSSSSTAFTAHDLSDRRRPSSSLCCCYSAASRTTRARLHRRPSVC